MERNRRSYAGMGFSMSRRGREAVAYKEHPVTYWMERLVMDEKQIAELLIYMGNHHVGPRFRLTPFYRLPDKDDPEEMRQIFKAFHSVAARKLNFIRIMSEHFQKSVSEKGKSTPLAERPRKKKKRRRRVRGRRKGSNKKNKILQRW